MYTRKKNTRQRGGTTHGHGSMKKWRGAGHRGGRGLAGSGKRADSKKPSLWKEKYFGKTGFKFKGKSGKTSTVNISYLEENLELLISNKLVEKEGEVYKVDLKKLGYDKLLNKGRVKHKFKINIEFASKNTIKAIEESGGEVLGLKK